MTYIQSGKEASYMTTFDKPSSPGEVLEHFGKKGMKWGVTNKTSTSSSSAKKKKTSTPRSFTRNQKVAAAAFVGVGATIAASMLAGPVGGMVVSGLTRAFPMTTTDRTGDARLINTSPNSPLSGTITDPRD
jgi:hypothetical protein